VKHVTYLLSLPKDYCEELRDAAGKTGLSMVDIILQNSKLGLPLLLRQLGPARITNVPPLPAKIVRAVYSEPDDDAEGIEHFMAAQAKTIQEPLGRPHAGLHVALAQLPIEDGKLEQNMRLAEAAAWQAAEQKADFLNLPEAADWGWLYQQARRDAQPLPGKYTDCLAALAKRHKMWVSAGCL
jgi:hypothetical protein